MSQAVHEDPRFLDLLDRVRDADLGFTNLETTIHDFEGPPAAQSGGTWTRADPCLIEDIKWMGFDVVSTANNHSLDYMHEGLLSTLDYLEAYGLPCAGTGPDLAAARAPTYVDTGQGRVALIAASSTFALFGAAGHARRDMRGRPGLNPLRYETHYEAPKETIESLRTLSRSLGFQAATHNENEFSFLRNRFVVSDSHKVVTKPHAGDMDGNLEVIGDAARQADWVLFSLHAHESRVDSPERPAEFIETFCRACIDSGAHAVMGHGPHVLRGIEIYKERPIMYSLGNFIFQNDTIQKMPSDFYEQYQLNPYSGTPADAFDSRERGVSRPGFPPGRWFTKEEKYWRSVLAKVTFNGDKLSELKLYPVRLGQEKTRSQRGRPVLAVGEEADSIIEELGKLSDPYGTEILLEDGIGSVKL